MEFGEIGQNKDCYAIKVTDVSTNGKPICDFLLVINTNWHPISYRFEVIADYCSNFGREMVIVFFSPMH